MNDHLQAETQDRDDWEHVSDAASAVVSKAQTRAAPSVADPVITMIERVATDPNADIEKLERMLAMKERIDLENAKAQYNQALAAAQSEMPTIAARHNNDQTRSKFAKLSDIYNEAKPIAAKHGLSFSAVPVLGAREGFMNMRWTLRCGNYSESDVSEVPLDDKGMKGTKNKTGTHAYGSTTSYGRRYLFCAVFDIAIGDDNDRQRAGAGATISAEQFTRLQEMIALVGVDLSVVLESERIEELEQLPMARFEPVSNRLRKTASEKGITL